MREGGREGGREGERQGESSAYQLMIHGLAYPQTVVFILLLDRIRNCKTKNESTF